MPTWGIGICADATLWNWNLRGRHPAEFEFASMRNSLKTFPRNYRLNSLRMSLRNSQRNQLDNSLRVSLRNSLNIFLKDSLRNDLRHPRLDVSKEFSLVSLSQLQGVVLRNSLRHSLRILSKDSSGGLSKELFKEVSR